MSRPGGVTQLPFAPIKSQVAARLFPQPIAPRTPQRRTRPENGGQPLPTPITMGQAFRVCFVLFIGFSFTPVPHLEAPKALSSAASVKAG